MITKANRRRNDRAYPFLITVMKKPKIEGERHILKVPYQYCSPVTAANELRALNHHGDRGNVEKALALLVRVKPILQIRVDNIMNFTAQEVSLIEMPEER